VAARVDQGDALMALREETGSSGVFYVGDDATDEAAFERLGRRDVGIKVGEGPTLATLRVESQVDVGPLLARLLELRVQPARSRSGRRV
jgi:trehalose-6-phosphatase